MDRSNNTQSEQTPFLADVSYSPTFAALLWLSRAKLPTNVTVDPAAIDWPAVIRLAAEQAMLPILAGNILARMPADSSHASARAFVQKSVLQNTQRNLALSVETLRVLTALDKENIQAFAFKGCVLALTAYDNLGCRKCGDIDLLIRKADVMPTYQVLERCGYASWVQRTPAQQAGHLNFDCEWELLNEQRRTAIDLHWGLSGRNSGIPLSLEPFWQRQERSILAGQTIRTLSPADLFVTLCVHAAKHQWQRLEWIYTLAAVLRRFPSFPWPQVWQEAAASGTTRILALGLILADGMYETPLAEPVREQVRSDRKAYVLACKAAGWLLGTHARVPSDHELRKFNATMKVNFSDQVYYWLCASMTPTAKDYIAELPTRLNWVYYVIRVIRLLGRSLTGYR